MRLYKLRSYHLIDDKVYLELPYSDTHIICSKDGFLYLRYLDITIHKYLLRKSAESPPYPLVGDNLVPHLFEYNKIYLNYEAHKNSGDTISFFYFMKASNNESLFAEIYLQEVEKFCNKAFPYEPKKETLNLNREQLEKILYDISDEKSKYIIHSYKGLKYAKHLSEPISICEDFIDLSDDGIINLYNSEMESLKRFGEIVAKQKSTGFVKVKNISDVPSFPIEPRGFMSNPHNLLIISKHNISIQKISISFVSKDNFKVTTSEILLTEPLIKDMILSSISHIEDFKSFSKKGKKQRRGWQ